jgi:aminoglycoside phosphotransferase (APT) family kinase protein
VVDLFYRGSTSVSGHVRTVREPASADRIADPVRFAVDLAGFLTALRSADPAGGPRPGKHNWFRGGTLRTYDGAAQSALTALDGHINARLAPRVWPTALDARGEGAESWFHGDVAEGNPLLSDGVGGCHRLRHLRSRRPGL